MRILPTVVCPWALGLLVGLQDGVAAEPQPLFADPERIAITIEAPFSEILSERAEDAEYRPGFLTYTGADGSSVKLDVGLRVRGIFRRRRDVCRYPPLRVNFKKSQVAGTLFAGQDKLKLVSDCVAGRDASQLVLKEFLAYRIFNQISERSFRVRLLDVTYTEARGRGARTAPAFFIEHDDAMAQRNGATVRKDARIRPSELDRVHTNLVEVFQYLIGNTDFSMVSGPEGACCHNVVPITETPGRYYAVPYDFDFAGLVAAPYAKPSPILGIRNVRQRLYRGLCSTSEHLTDSVAKFNDAAAAIDALIDEIPGLTDRSVRVTRKYVRQFYATINDPEKLDKRLRNKCR